MTSRRAKGNVTEADVGKWANLDSIFYDGICGRPWTITAVSKSRVYVKSARVVRDGEYVEEKYVSAKTVKFVSDTEEEAERFHELGEAQMSELRAVEKAVKKKYREEIDKLVVDTDSQVR
jgi:hypothetical protein